MKFISVFLTMAILLCAVPIIITEKPQANEALEEEAVIPEENIGKTDLPVLFEPAFTELVEWPAYEWMDSVKSRALLTFLLSLDVALHQEDLNLPATEFDFSESSFVGRDDLMTSVFIQCGNGIMMITYQPFTGEASYTILESARSTSDPVFGMTLASMYTEKGGELYANDHEAILEVAKEIVEIFE